MDSNHPDDSTQSHGCFPTVPIAYKSLKAEVRSGLTSQARQYWWPALPHVQQHVDVDTHVNLKDIAKHKFVWAIERTYGKDYHRKPDLTIDERAGELMALLIQQHDLVEPGLIQAFLNIVVRVIQSDETCFQLCCDVIARPDWYISLTPIQYHLKTNSFIELVTAYMSAELPRLQAIQALNDEHLNHIFVNLFYSILPFSYVIRIVDAFLLEGSKVLHRFGLAILRLNADILANENITTGTQFWNEIKKRGEKRSFQVDEMCNTAYNIGRSIFDIMTKGKFARAKLKQIEDNKKATLTDIARSPLNLKFNIWRNNPTVNHNSLILNNEMATRLQSYLPDTQPLEKFKLNYSGSRDGWNIDILFHNTTGYSPCILLVKSLQGAVFGAFLPMSVSPPSREIRGNGTTFVFRLNESNPACYKWVKLQPKAPIPLNPKTNMEPMTVCQFAICDVSGIAIGGSDSKNTNAIRIDQDLRQCVAGESDTFLNPPLAPEEAIQPFLIAELEILCVR